MFICFNLNLNYNLRVERRKKRIRKRDKERGRKEGEEGGGDGGRWKLKASKTAKNTLRVMRREISYGGHAKWSGSGYILKGS